MSWSEHVTDKELNGARRLREEDLEVVGGCAAVHPDRRGGQHVAMECHGLRLTHKPTGISVFTDDERSQMKCRLAAYVQLCRVLEIVRVNLGEYAGKIRTQDDT